MAARSIRVDDDVEVLFSPSLRHPAVGDVGPTDAPPLIFQALQEQAGLKLNDTG